MATRLSGCLLVIYPAKIESAPKSVQQIEEDKVTLSTSPIQPGFATCHVAADAGENKNLRFLSKLA